VAGKTRPVEFDAVVEQIGDQLRLRASTTVDKKTLAMSGGRIGMLLPAVVHIRARLAAEAINDMSEKSAGDTKSR
jgi:hypothetical protein